MTGGGVAPRATRGRALVLVLLALAVIGVAALILRARRAPAAEPPAGATTHRHSQLYELEVTRHPLPLPKSVAHGGGLAAFGDGYLVETGDGDLYVAAEEGAGRGLAFRRYPYRVPIDAAAFVAAAGDRVNHTYFRAAGVLTQEVHGRLRVLASHHFWKDAERCFVMRVSALEGPRDDVLRGRPGLDWETIYETSPCLPVDFPGHPPFFGGLEAGGRMALLDDADLLVTIGDQGFDGVTHPLSVSQDPASAYGKTILVHLEGGSPAEVYTLGHRNPQGLCVAAGGVAWLTEHGPEGGDELNLLQRGKNYGWPAVTYGVDYGMHAWPSDPTPGSHDGAGFTQPFYAWVPSIAVSSLLVSDSPRFPLWKGDLVVAALKDHALHRVRIREDRVVVAERIPIGERIRDLLQARGGELLLLTDSGVVLAVRPGDDAESGETLFAPCAGCHVARGGRMHRVGPDLHDIVGRRVASAEGFPYSPALRSFGGAWTRARLDAFLESPEAVVPGTSMAFAGVKNAAARARLIAYLAGREERAPGDEGAPD
jgi:glucose/arabinose dehydrogenase